MEDITRDALQDDYYHKNTEKAQNPQNQVKNEYGENLHTDESFKEFMAKNSTIMDDDPQYSQKKDQPPELNKDGDGDLKFDADAPDRFKDALEGNDQHGFTTDTHNLDQTINTQAPMVDNSQ